MQWSRLKKLVESRFCEALRGRLELHSTRYRGAHDEVGRAWVTFDRVEIHSACDLKGRNEAMKAAGRIQAANPLLTSSEAWDLAWEEVWQAGHETREQFHQALHASLQLSIDEAMASHDNLVHALAIVDKRLGVRRLRQVAIQEHTHPLAKRLLEIRTRLDAASREASLLQTLRD
jgi:hypothetical protein